MKIRKAHRGSSRSSLATCFLGAIALLAGCGGGGPLVGIQLINPPLGPRLGVLAGNFGGPGSVDETGGSARFYGPSGMAIDASGAIYVSDHVSNIIRKIDSRGGVATLAGSAGTQGYADGLGVNALFRGPNGLAVDGLNTVYVADTNNHVIRRISASGAVTTLAGRPTVSGALDGAAGIATFNMPSGICLDSTGNLLVVDSGNHTIRSVSAANGTVSTLSGIPGVAGYLDGSGAVARYNYPAQITRNPDGSFSISDANNHVVRRMLVDGSVTTVAGQPGLSGFADGSGAVAKFNAPAGILSDAAGNLMIADLMNYCLRKVSLNGVVSTYSGFCTLSGNSDGPSSTARYYAPQGLVADSVGNLFVSDINGNTIRKISVQGDVSTFAGLGEVAGSIDGQGSTATFLRPSGVFVDAAGSLVVADRDNNKIRGITSAGQVTTAAVLASSYPEHVVADAAGNRYFSSGQKSVIVKVDQSGNTSIFAGAWGVSGSADGPGTSARFYLPIGLAVDTQGNIFVADQGNHTIRKITPAGVVSTFAGTATVRGSQDGVGALARFYYPRGLGIDRQGNLYVADSNNYTVRKITTNANVTTLAGVAGQAGATDGGVGAAKFQSITGVAPDDEGNVFVADRANGTVRKVDSRGVVSTVVGVTGVHSFKAGPLPGLLDHPTGVAVRGSTLYITTSNGVAVVELK